MRDYRRDRFHVWRTA